MKTHEEKEYRFLKEMQDYEDSKFCKDCGDNSKITFVYQRTVANGEVWFCKKCKTENLTNLEPKED